MRGVSTRFFRTVGRPHPRRCFGLILAAVLAGQSTPAAAQVRPTPRALVQQQTATSVLGLEGPDADAAAALTTALRSAFAQRGLGGGEEVTLVELRLTMGCEVNDPSCLSEGGGAMGVEKLVYGHLLPASGGYELRLSLLDVSSKTVEREVRRELSAGVLASPPATEAAARDVVNEILATSTPYVGPAEEQPRTIAPDQPIASPGPARQDTSGLEWGRYSPVPTWKWAALGTSAALTAVALGTAIGTSVAIRPDGPLYEDLIDAAEGSLRDNKPDNDINPNSDEDLCALARAEAAPPPGSDPDKTYYTNRDVTIVCNRADAIATTATVSWVATGLFAASTAVFTTLLFVHRRTATTATRRGLRLGLGPTPAGGFVVGGSVRF